MKLPVYVTRHAGLTLSIMAVTTADGAVTVLLPALLHAQGKDPALIGLLIAVPAVLAFLLRLPGGALFSEARARRLLLAAMALGGCALLLFPWSANPAILALVGAVYGGAYSVSTTVSMAMLVASVGHGQQRNQAVSIYVAGMALGYALGSLGGGFLGNQFGIGGGFVGAAAVCGLGLLLVRLNKSVARPSGAVAQAAADAPRLRNVASVLAIMFDPLVFFVITGAFFINILLSQFNTIMPLTLLPIGVSLAQIGLIRGSWSLTNAVGRTIGGTVLGRIGPKRAQTGGLILQGILLALFALRLPLGAYVLLTIAAASGRAVAYVANTVTMSEIDPRRLSRGMASGFMNAAGDLGKILGPISGGLIARQAGVTNFWLIGPPLFLCLYLALLAGRAVTSRQAQPVSPALQSAEAVQPALEEA